jgi:urea carboxylase
VRTLRVIYGPHGAPEFFAPEYMATFCHRLGVHFNSSRTGVRLIGPKPLWARDSGGEAGLHPSNIHDNPYAVGAVDFTGDMPVILGPDGPSLGGFVCPVTVIEADLWQWASSRPGIRCVSWRWIYPPPGGWRQGGAPSWRPAVTRRSLAARAADVACGDDLRRGGQTPGGAPLRRYPSAAGSREPELDLVLRFAFMP